MRLTIEEIIAITNGTLLQGDKTQIVETMNSDSRFDLSPNGLFIPIIGERLNGHNFIPSAIENGAIATLCCEDVEMQEGITYIRVDDCICAMQQIGAYCRSLSNIPVVAITGSVGKTTTKEMIACAISNQLKTFKTIGNSNSQVGVPKMMALLDESYEIAVIEAGMSMPNEMGRLAPIILPNITIMTNIGVSHIENLGTKLGIFEEKFKLALAMKDNSPLIINGDDDVLGTCEYPQRYNVIRYGLKEYNNIRAIDIESSFNSTDFTAIVVDKEVKVHINAIGEHMVLNALAALAAGYILNLDIDKCAKSLSNYAPIPGRQVIENINNVTYIEDYYNASPDSMKASINVLTSIKCLGQRIAVLGDMKELGKDAEKYHRNVGEYLTNKNISVVISVGELGKFIAETANDIDNSIKPIICKDNNEAYNQLLPYLKRNNAILLKASNSMNFREIMSKIKKYVAS